MTEAKLRGSYRSIFTAIWDDPDFQALDPDGKLLLLHLRTSPLGNLAGIFRFYKEAISEHTGLSEERITRALQALYEAGFLEVEKNVIWIKDALRSEPWLALPIENPKHLSAITTIILSLPRLQIVSRFCKAYGLDTLCHTLCDTLSTTLPPTLSHGVSDTQRQRQTTETETDTDPKTERERETERERGAGRGKTNPPAVPPSLVSQSLRDLGGVAKTKAQLVREIAKKSSCSRATIHRAIDGCEGVIWKREPQAPGVIFGLE